MFHIRHIYWIGDWIGTPVFGIRRWKRARARAIEWAAKSNEAKTIETTIMLFSCVLFAQIKRHVNNMAPITAQINFYWKIYDYVFGYKIAMFISGLYLKWCVCVSVRTRPNECIFTQKMRKGKSTKCAYATKVYGRRRRLRWKKKHTGTNEWLENLFNRFGFSFFFSSHTYLHASQIQSFSIIIWSLHDARIKCVFFVRWC